MRHTIKKLVVVFFLFAFFLNSCLEKAVSEIIIKKDVLFLQREETKRISDNSKSITKAKETVVVERKPIKKKYVWSACYQQCIKCGSSDKPPGPSK